MQGPVSLLVMWPLASLHFLHKKWFWIISSFISHSKIEMSVTLEVEGSQEVKILVIFIHLICLKLFWFQIVLKANIEMLELTFWNHWREMMPVSCHRMRSKMLETPLKYSMTLNQRLSLKRWSSPGKLDI